MSIEKAVDEMYGDTMTDDEEAEEIQRIKEQNGYLEAEEPKVPDDEEIDPGADADGEEE
ncbi:hypothetical protein D3C76_1225990 [compost metagenome]